MVMTQARPETGLLIAITSGDDSDRRALEAGASVALHRPFERSDLQEAIERARARNKKRMLVVDDDQDALDLVREALDGDGFEIRSAMDGRKVIEVLDNWNPDIVLLDLMLPELDGFEVVHRMALNPKWKSIPVVLMTARDLTHEERRALGTNRLRMIQKGDFSRDELVAEINAALSNRNHSEGDDSASVLGIQDYSPAGGAVNGAGEPADEFGTGR
jgi:DNA-binding response OmpR family regulator